MYTRTRAYTQARARTHARAYTHTHTHTHTHTRTDGRAHTHTHPPTHTHTHTHTPTHARTHALTHARTHARTHTHVRTHARTHTHTHARRTFIHFLVHANSANERLPRNLWYSFKAKQEEYRLSVHVCFAQRVTNGAPLASARPTQHIHQRSSDLRSFSFMRNSRAITLGVYQYAEHCEGETVLSQCFLSR